MGPASNPTVPAAWEFMVTAMGALILLLTAAAVISLAREKTLAPGMKFLCLLGVLGFPVLGPAIWFFHLHRSRRSHPGNPSEDIEDIPAARRQGQHNRR